MELHPLDLPDLPEPQPVPVRFHFRSPRTVAEVLDGAGRQMDLEDAYDDWLHGRPVKLRHPRRTLRRWLAAKRGKEKYVNAI